MAEWIGYDPTTADAATAFKAASPSILRTTPQNKTRQIIVARLELAILCLQANVISIRLYNKVAVSVDGCGSVV